DLGQERQGPPLLLVQLREEAVLAEVEGAARPPVLFGTVVAVVPAPARGAAGERAPWVGDVILRPRLPLAQAPPQRLLVVQRHLAPELLHPGQVLLRPGLGLPGRVGGARAVRAEEVHAHGPEVLAEVGAADVAGVGGGDQAARVELAGQLSELLEVRETGEPLVLDVPFVRQVQVPVAVRLQGRDERLDGPAVGLQGLEPGGAGRAVPARERYIDHDALLVAGGHQALEPLQGRLAGLALPIHRRDVLPERRPGGPDADPVEAVLLEVRDVAADGLVRGAERPVVTDAEQEGWAAVDGEARAVRAQARNGLRPSPGQASRGEG